MHLLDDNKLLKHLKNSNIKLYLASLLFCKHAEDKWMEEINKSTVRHGYSHICNVIKYIEYIIYDSNDNIQIDVDDHFLFILIASAYCHDIGMQAYYTERLPYLKDRKTLSHEDIDDIRANHSDTIGDALTRLASPIEIKEFFGSNIIKIKNMIDKKDNITIDDIYNIIIVKRRWIALVASYHNLRLKEFINNIDLLCTRNELIINNKEKEDLLLMAAILQFSDAIDMSVNRIDVSDFLTKVNNVDALLQKHIYERYVLKKMLLCYVIDEVKFERVGNQLQFIFCMTANTANLADHKEVFKECKKRYLHRLMREDGDCLDVIENKLGDKIIIRVDSEYIRPIDAEKMLPRNFFDILKNEEYDSIDNLLITYLRQIESRGCLVYAKLKSEITGVYFGGLAICADEEARQQIERAYFYEDEWRIDFSKEYDYFDNNIINSIGDVKIKAKYSKYIKLWSKLNIQSEIYYHIRHGGKVIGFVNIHYQRILTKDEQNEEIKALRMVLMSLGHKIADYHDSFATPKYSQMIETATFLTSAARKELTKYYQRMFSDNISKSEKITVQDLITIINNITHKNIKHKRHDAYDMIILHEDIFRQIIMKIIAALKHIAIIDIDVNNSKLRSYVEINLYIHDFPSTWSTYVKKADSYLNTIDMLPPSGNIRVKEYEHLLPFKSFMSLFGGKIESNLSEGGLGFHISTMLPKRQRYPF